jgi:hypothetical protein
MGEKGSNVQNPHYVRRRSDLINMRSHDAICGMWQRVRGDDGHTPRDRRTSKNAPDKSNNFRRPIVGRIARDIDQKGIAYGFQMGLRPHTLYGIADSPIGLAAYFLDHDDASSVGGTKIETRGMIKPKWLGMAIGSYAFNTP